MDPWEGREALSRETDPASSDPDAGFTLIELMVTVLIVAILIGLALPAYAGAKRRASDRAAQQNLRTTLSAEKIYYTGALVYADNSTGQMTLIEPSITYDDGMSPTATKTIWLGLSGDVLYLSTMSTTGECFYVVDDPFNGTGYARDPACAAADSLLYNTAGWS